MYRPGHSCYERTDLINIWNVFWESTSGGPSPDRNQRVELFLYGCRKAADGNPCKGCFNQELWCVPAKAPSETPKQVADQIIRFAPNKYITIVGGEPTDQMDELVELTKLLKDAGFHIIVFTHHELYQKIDFFLPLLDHIDILIDGHYDETRRTFIEGTQDGFSDVVGSSNQIVWDVKAWKENKWSMEGYIAQRIDNLYLKTGSNDLVYILTRTSAPSTALSLKEVGYVKAVND